jgi:cyclopropane-fatty-acyl-phospholipid synthase
MSKSAVEHTETGATPWTRLASWVVEKIGVSLIGNPKFGAVTVILPNGRARTVGNSKTGEHAVLRLNNFKVITEAMRRGTVGFAAAYMNGDIEVDDLTALFRFFLQNRDMFESAGNGWFRRAATDLHYHMSRRNTLEGSKKNIAEHYDLGNDFYGEWLDPSMTYSSALFEGDATLGLEAAQTRKYEALARAAGMREGDHVLEIGSGWGGFASYAARTVGCRVTGLTISPAQLEIARRRIFEQGLAEKVSFRLQDYRDERGSYDRIASIEMFEAVGQKYWGAYFDTLRKCLRPGGTAGLQIITISEQGFGNYSRRPDFIQRYVFPGGMLPTPQILRTLGQEHGLSFLRERVFAQDYARTLAEWRDRFWASWEKLRPLGFDDRFKKLWEFYLHYCEAGFRAEFIDVRQVIYKA